MANLLLLLNSPNGDRTRVFGVRGRYPRPLDDGTTNIYRCFFYTCNGPRPVSSRLKGGVS